MILGFVIQFPEIERLNSLPKPKNMSFNTFMDIPPVYENSAPEFTKCHLFKMTRPDNICIIATQENGGTKCNAPTSIEDKSRGIDEVGNFGLSGCVLKNGKVWITETYINHNIAWTWRGHITPFGKNIPS
ncbi:hypothetical protein GQ44DRAFT_817163 [Phaeosphaeriaceae sp. PMI808]|nr:hypothetical protein GQ44DRAFT_817163 [Phaeosphaeriaceae sp. PMI808]